jgi:Spy/CpxP family protein refolding chaperone
MKLYKFSLVTVVALGSLLACNSITSAQDTNATRRAERRGQMVQQRVERMTTELNLNADQKAKVTALLEGQAKQRREIFGDTSLPREERRDKMRALTEEENKQLKVILTPEQFEKWQKLREQMRSRRPGGPGQSGSPAPAPAPEPTTPGKAQ